MNFILIDGSYFVFHRYHALLTWCKHAQKDDMFNSPSESEEFIGKFRKTFVEKVKDIPKKLKLKESIIIVGKDCPRKDIWRMDIYPEYKGTRVNDDKFMGDIFFGMAYNENLFIEGGAKAILSCPRLEADDCIALTAKHIIEKHPDSTVWIIANDMDYLQLCSDKIKLINLQFKYLKDGKNSTGNSEKDLFCKIVSGDKSDNIPPIHSKCGIKTAIKYYENPDILNKKLQENSKIKDVLERNKIIIDFNNIPQSLVDTFYKTCLHI